MSAITNTHPQIMRWVLSGRLTEDQGMILCDEARAREQHYDPYGDDPRTETEWDTHPWAEKVWLINEYHEVERYGGPEEGGWWYSEYRPTERIIDMFRDKDEAYEAVRHLNAFANIELRRNAHRSDKGLTYKVEACAPREPAGPMRYS